MLLRAKNFFTTILLVGLVLVIGYQVYSLNSNRIRLSRSLSELNGKVTNLEREKSKLVSDLEYFTDLENLAKEFKSRFNYKRPGENLIIVIPESGNEIMSNE